MATAVNRPQPNADARPTVSLPGQPLLVQGVVVLPLLAQAADAGSADADAGTVAEGSGAATFDELYEQYNGEYIVGGLSLAVVFLLVYSMYRSARSVSKYGEGLGKAVRRAIKSHEDNGNFGAGADILFDHEMYDDAGVVGRKTVRTPDTAWLV